MQLQERKATAASLKSSLPCQHPISNKLETCYMLRVVEKVMPQYFNILKHWCFSWCSPFYFSWLWCLFLFVPSMLLACWVYSISSYYNGCSGSIEPWKPTSRKFIIKLSATVLSVKMSHMHMPKISLSKFFHKNLPSYLLLACRNYSMLHFSAGLLVFETDTECTIDKALENHKGCGRSIYLKD